MGYKKGEVHDGLPETHVANASSGIEPASPDITVFVVANDLSNDVGQGGLQINGERVLLVGSFTGAMALLLAACGGETASNRGGVKVQEIKPGLIGDAPKAASQELNEVPVGTMQIGAIDRFSRGQWTLMPDQDGFALGSKLVADNSDGTTSVMYVPQGAMAEDSGGKLSFKDNTQAFVWTGVIDSETLPKVLEDLETSGFARSEVDVLDPISADSLRMGATSISVELIGEKKFGTIHIGAPYLGRGSLSIEVPFTEVQDYVTFGENQKAVDTYFDEVEVIHQQRAEKAASEVTETPMATNTPVTASTTPEATRTSGNGSTRNTTETVETVSQPTPLDMAVKLVERYPLETGILFLAVVVLGVVSGLTLKSHKDRETAVKKEAAAEKKLKEATAQAKDAAEKRALAIQGLDAITALSDELAVGATYLNHGADEFRQSSERAGARMGAMTASIAVDAGAAGVRAADQGNKARERAQKIKAAATSTRQQIS